MTTTNTIDTRWLLIGILLAVGMLVVPVMATTETFYPVDAAIFTHNPAGTASFYDLRNGAGTSVDKTYGDKYTLNLYTLSGSGFDYESHPGLIFNTSGLDDTAVIDSGYIAVWETGANVNLGNFNTAFTGGSTDNGNVSFATGDYNSWVAPALTSYAVTSTGTDVWKNRTLTPGGRAYINKTGNTTFYEMSAWDVDNTSPVWEDSTYSRSHMGWGTGSTTTYPKLVLTYHIPSVPVANFTANRTSGTVPVSILFTDTSANLPDNRNWSFGDGTYSTSTNPTHTYSSAGLYTVSLWVNNTMGEDTEERVDYINVTPKPPVAAFTGFPLSGPPPLEVHFTNSSNYLPTSFLWDFGDGTTENNTEQDPYHTYAGYGTYTVSLTATNAYGSDVETKPTYISVADATYGEHPYLFFHNITEVDGFTFRDISPWSGWYAEIYKDRNSGIASSPAKPLYYHICKESGGTGCSAYANSTIAELQTYPIISLGSADSMHVMNYAIAYDLIAGTKDTGETTLTTAVDNQIRDRLAQTANYNYRYLKGEYCSENARSCLNQVQYFDLKAMIYVTVWVYGETLHDYDVTGKGFPAYSYPDNWIKAGTTEFFDDDTILTGTTDPGGYFYYMVDKDSGKDFFGGYVHYFDQHFQVIPTIYSRIHGNVYEVHPEFEKFYADNWLYSPMPSTFMSNQLDPGGGYSIDYTSTGLTYLPERERSWLRWMNKNTTEMYNAGVYDNEGHRYPESAIQSYWVRFLTYGDYTDEPVYRPVHKNYLNDVYSIMRTGWTATDDWLGFMGAVTRDTGSNALDLHPDQLAIEFFGHGDHTLLDAGQVRYLIGSGIFGGTYDARGEPVMHNVLMFRDPRNVLSGPYGGTFSNVTGAGFLSGGGATFPYKIDSDALGYVRGLLSITYYHTSYHYQSPMPSAITWSREIVAPQNEYFVVVDRARSPATWFYKSHWNFGSVNGENRTSNQNDQTLILNTHVTGSLSIDGNNYDWVSKPFPSTELDTGYTTNTVTWNSTNMWGVPISTKLFTVPESPVSFYKYVAKVGGYGGNGASNHEYTNPHVYFNSPENTNLYRITAIQTSFVSDTNLPTQTELAVTGTGSAMQIVAGTSTQTDYFYTGTGTSDFGPFQTDADTVYVRESEPGTIKSYLLVNGTYLNESGSRVFSSTTRLNYISVNKTTLGQGGKFNVSGTGETVLSFYNTAPDTEDMTRDGSAFAAWTMDGTTLEVTTLLSEHFFEYGVTLEGYPDEGPGEFMYNETQTESQIPTETFTAPSTNADGNLIRTGVREDWSTISTGEGNSVDLDGSGTNKHISATLQANTTDGDYSLLTRAGWSADTSSIPDNADITAAWFTITSDGKNNGVGSLGATITDFEPADYSSLVASDFNKTQGIVYTSNISYSSFPAAGSSANFYFTNLSAINKAGITSLMFRLIPDVDGDNSTITWSNSTYSTAQFYDTSNGGSGIPKLNVIYTVPATEAPVAAIDVDVTSGYTPLNVSFTDISTNNPTNRLWTFEGTNTSESETPEWTFETPGTYSVSLYVENEAGSDTAYQNIIVTESGEPPEGPDSIRINATTTGDATLERYGGSETLATIRNSAGTELGPDPNTVIAGIWASTDPSQYEQNLRIGLSLPTATLPDDQTPVSATLYLYGNAVETGLGNPNLVISGFTPTSSTLAYTDYNKGTTTRIADNLSYIYLTGGGWNPIELNVSAINLTANTNIMIRTTWDYGNTAPTWSNANFSYVAFDSAESGSSTSPYLLVEYEEPIPPLTLDPGFQFYQDDNIWNTRVDDLPVHSMSSTYIANSNSSYFMWLSPIMPINVVDSSTSLQYLTSVEYPGNYSIGPYQIPDDPEIEDSGGDHHMLVVNPNANMLYELYQPVQAENGTWSAYGGQVYNLSDYALIPIGQWSTDVAGLPITPGIIRYDELDSGHIDHASRVSFYTTGDQYTWPARTGGNQESPNFPPTGQRFRLKASFDTSSFSPHAQTILNSWKTYGAMLADNTLDPQAWLFSTDTDPRWLSDEYPALWDEMANVHGSDFEAVDVSSLMIDEDSGQALQGVSPPVAHFQMDVISEGGSTPIGLAPVANFVANDTTIYVGDIIQLTDTSANNPEKWMWRVNNLQGYEGGGVIYYYTRNVTTSWAQFLTPGNAWVELTATNEYGSSTLLRSEYIHVSAAPVEAPVADFTANRTTVAPETEPIQFTDLSTNTPTSWHWTFGEDLFYSTDQNPVYTYLNAGTYTVVLTATNADGSDTETKTGYITVEPAGDSEYGAPSTVTVGTRTGTVGGGYAFSVNGITYGGSYNSIYTAGVDAVAGGSGTYQGTTVSTKSQLLTALTGASSGDVIYISPTANIDMGSSEYVGVPAGVTIASNRGSSGSPGGRIYTKTAGSGWNKPVFEVDGNGARFTGLRLEGETYSENYPGTESTYRVGIMSHDYTVEVDNCELYGFAYADVYVYDIPTGGAKFHHNYAHGSQNLYEGYAFNNEGGDMIVEGNVMGHNRHSVTSAGTDGETYTVRYNKIIGDGFINDGVHLDVHQDESDGSGAGEEYHIYNNDVTQCVGCSDGMYMPFLEVLDSASTGAYVNNNVINTNWGSGSNEQGFSYPILQVGSNTKMFATDNYWKGTLYPTNTGVVQ